MAAARTLLCVTRNLLLFGTAAVFEIAGCYAFWHWLRRGGSAAWTVAGVLSLVCFAVALAKVDSPFTGRAYAAYGGIYIAMAMSWLWLFEGQRPTMTDLLGAGLAIAGTLIILSPIVRR